MQKRPDDALLGHLHRAEFPLRIHNNMRDYRRMRHSEARRILLRHCLELDGKVASSNHSVSKEQNMAAAAAVWWLTNDSSSPPPDSPRSRAYLRAYLEIAGPRFFATGIPLDDGYMLPDRGVMKSLLEAGYVVLTSERSPRFEITEKGRTLVGA